MKSIQIETLMPMIRERLSAGRNIRGVGFQGVSMMPMLRQGRDSVELAPLPEKLKKYDLPLYRASGGKYVMHRIVDVKGDHYICLGDNTYHYERVAPERMVAVVCAFTRDGKRISVEDGSYRLYCRFRVATYPVRKFMKQAEWWLRRQMKRIFKR